ncbi:hypothetical protein J437_LFUL005077 [Ladona fulva]|uniref:Peptidase S1 domain-containing protein n=1 Tax=Ladona fulva TaxID=123851 RepID=A0A8K0NW92_LADFU|nr:hypothetical protein J437_LFUL005077 [Ladona fulva]
MKTLCAALLTLAVCACVQASVNWTNVKHVLPRVPEQTVTGKQFVGGQRQLYKWRLNGGSRIVNGNTASLGQFPYQVAVNIDAGYFCGGSIVSKDYILTAAHCGVLGNSFHIYLGSLSPRSIIQPRKQVIVSTNVQVHENYDPNSLKNDIAILKLNQAAQFDNYVQPINLPRQSQSHLTFENERVIASGWGKTSDNAGGISSTLMYTELTTITNQECANYYGGLITISQICAKGDNKQSTCNGDSGGPLALNDGGSPMLLGVLCGVDKMKTYLAVLFVLAVCACVQAYGDWSKVKHVLPTLPDQKITGKQFANQKRIGSGTRIVGGSTATEGQFPYQAAVNIDAGYFCGGSLVSRNYVITAAHCGVLGNSFTIYLGAVNIRDPTEPNRETIISREVHVHENYDENTLANDIAILKLWSPADLTQYIGTINLPTRSMSSETFVGQEVIASGWGKTSDGAGGVSSTLQYTPLKVITNEDCASYYGDIITISQICALGDNRQSTCNGDSGGPLAIYDGENSLLVGVISFVSGAGCESGYPSGYTRVTTHLDWIEAHSDVVINP